MPVVGCRPGSSRRVVSAKAKATPVPGAAAENHGRPRTQTIDSRVHAVVRMQRGRCCGCGCGCGGVYWCCWSKHFHSIASTASTAAVVVCCLVSRIAVRRKPYCQHGLCYGQQRNAPADPQHLQRRSAIYAAVEQSSKQRGKPFSARMYQCISNVYCSSRICADGVVVVSLTCVCRCVWQCFRPSAHDARFNASHRRWCPDAR